MTINLDEMTLPKLLKSNAVKFGTRKAALREKSRGIWQSCSWQEYYDNVKFLSLGLTSLGLVAGDKVAIMGNNRPTSLYAELAAQAAGAVSVGIYQDATLKEVRRTLKLFQVKMVVAEDQEQVDKVLELSAALPGVTAIVACNRRGMRNYREPLLTFLSDLLERGKEQDALKPGEFEKKIEAGRGDDDAIICTTSGATGEPRGAVLSHKNLLSMALNLNEVDPKKPSDEFVSFLPLAWFGEQMMSLASALAVGFTVNFPEKSETVMPDLREIGPHIMFSPPRVWESIAATVQVKIMDTTPFKRFMFRTCMGIGEKTAALRLAGKPLSFSDQFLYRLAHICLFRALRDRLGLSRVRSALTGGSALGSDVLRFFHAIGVNLKQVYGLTELSGVACIHRDGDVRGETVGLPLPGTEIAISAHGEILARSAGNLKCYYNDHAATSAVLTDGWVRTGDAGRLDETGHLVVFDRLVDVMTLDDGSPFSPQQAENKLKFSPYISEAVVVGTSHTSMLNALICIDGRIVGKWAGDNKISYTTYSDLATRAEVSDFIGKEVAAVNRLLPANAQITRFALLYKELDADDEELTRTGKLRRSIVTERYHDLLEAMKNGKETIPVDVSIELQDGKSARIQTTVSFRNLPGR